MKMCQAFLFFFFFFGTPDASRLYNKNLVIKLHVFMSNFKAQKQIQTIETKWITKHNLNTNCQIQHMNSEQHSLTQISSAGRQFVLFCYLSLSLAELGQSSVGANIINPLSHTQRKKRGQSQGFHSEVKL